MLKTRPAWKSFDGVVGDIQIRLEGLKCIYLSSEPISLIPTFFLMYIDNGLVKNDFFQITQTVRSFQISNVLLRRKQSIKDERIRTA